MFEMMQYSQLKAELNTLKEEKYAQFQRRLIPDAGVILGVRMGALRSIAKRLSVHYFEYKLFFDEKCFEERMLLGLSLAYSKLKPQQMAEEIIWVANIFCTWAEVDSFCCTFKKKDEILFELAIKLLYEQKDFAVRTGVVMLMNGYLDDDHIDIVIKELLRIKNGGYYVKMGIAWALATAYINYPEPIYSLLDKGLPDPATAKMTVRKCIESNRICIEEKQRLRIL